VRVYLLEAIAPILFHNAGIAIERSIPIIHHWNFALKAVDPALRENVARSLLVLHTVPKRALHVFVGAEPM
jgi:hypothetical protein